MALELGGEPVQLVHWHKGRLCVKPFPTGKAKAPAESPTTLDLLDDWGIELEDLDAFLEIWVYRHHDECRRVRSTRRAMGTGLPVIRPGEARGKFLGKD